MREIVTISLGSTANRTTALCAQQLTSLSSDELALERFYSKRDLDHCHSLYVDHSSSLGPFSLSSTFDLESSTESSETISFSPPRSSWLSLFPSRPARLFPFSGWLHRGAFDRYSYGTASMEDSYFSNDLIDSIRTLIERCDCPSSAVFNSSTGGWAGVCGCLLPLVEEDFGLKSSVFLIDDVGSCEVNGLVTTALAYSELSKEADVIPLMVQKQAEKVTNSIDLQGLADLNTCEANSFIFSNFITNLLKPLVQNSKLNLPYFLNQLNLNSRNIFGSKCILSKKGLTLKELKEETFGLSSLYFDLLGQNSDDQSNDDDFLGNSELLVASGVVPSYEFYETLQSKLKPKSVLYLSKYSNSLPNSCLSPKIETNSDDVCTVSELANYGPIQSHLIDIFDRFSSLKRHHFAGDDHIPANSDWDDFKERIQLLKENYQ
ncbi:hypothetical protein P9112_000140 [Eukaryota sp. TZLM1-RC]